MGKFRVHPALAIFFLVFGILLLWLAWKGRKTSPHLSSNPIHPLKVDPNSLVGTWFGHGGQQNQLEVTVEITLDSRPPAPVRNAEDRQLVDAYAGGLLSPTYGSIAISGLGGSCDSFHATIGGGTASGNRVFWSGYAGKLGEDSGQAGQWEDTAKFTLSGVLNETGMSGTIRIISSDCEFDTSFPFSLSLVSSPHPIPIVDKQPQASESQISGMSAPEATTPAPPVQVEDPHVAAQRTLICTGAPHDSPGAELVGRSPLYTLMQRKLGSAVSCTAKTVNTTDVEFIFTFSQGGRLTIYSTVPDVPAHGWREDAVFPEEAKLTTDDTIKSLRQLDITNSCGIDWQKLLPPKELATGSFLVVGTGCTMDVYEDTMKGSVVRFGYAYSDD